jgi:hypothetical protein
MLGRTVAAAAIANHGADVFLMLKVLVAGGALRQPSPDFPCAITAGAVIQEFTDERLNFLVAAVATTVVSA